MSNNAKFISIRRKIMGAVFVISLISTIAFSLYAYTIQRDEIYEGHLNTLKAAALSVPHLLPDHFHDQPLTPDSISEEAYLDLMWMMTDWVASAGVSYVYSFVRQDGEILFSSTSGNEEQRRDGTWVKFLEPYDASEELRSVFDTGIPQMDEEQDDFGSFLSVVIPQTNTLGEVYLVGADIYIAEVQEELRMTLMRCAGIGVLIFLIMSLVGAGLSRRITGPLVTLAEQTRRLSANGFAPDESFEKDTGTIAEKSNDEVGRMANATVQMVHKLQDYIDNIKKFTAAKERLESELHIARSIQMSFLPKTFPPWPAIKEFDIYAALEPAREVGGDLYDFFLLDDDHLFFAVGDVSGKGVPSALFMAVTKTLFKGMADAGLKPGTILERVNNELRENNDALMFVTVFAGILNFRTGEFVYTNAGHNPPVLIRAGEKPAFLDIPKGFILGVDEFPYETVATRLQPGDRIVLYTDGVTEAMNTAKELYGEARLMDTVRDAHAPDACTLVKTLMQSVHAYAAGEPPSDDITILSLTYTAS
jgi:phosphoserine phosphatase RsbU/P